MLILFVGLYIYLKMGDLPIEVRSTNGKEINKKLEGLKKYIKDASLLNDKEK